MGLRLLPGERVRTVLRPHPVGFASRSFAALLPALWGVFLFWLARTDWWATGSEGRWFQVWTWLYGNTVALSVYAVIGMALLGAAVAVVTIQWRYLAWFVAGGLAAVAAGIVVGDHAWSVPATLVAWAIPGLLAVEAFRRSHRYHLTNLRIVFRGGLFVRRERQVRYEAITDLDTTQGIGALFDVGTIIPVTASGFGLGDDRAIVLGGAGVGGGKGVKGGIGAGVGAERGVQTGRARTFHQLTGIRPLGETKALLEELIQEASGTTHLRRQAELTRRVVAALEGDAGAVTTGAASEDDGRG